MQSCCPLRMACMLPDDVRTTSASEISPEISLSCHPHEISTPKIFPVKYQSNSSAKNIQSTFLRIFNKLFFVIDYNDRLLTFAPGTASPNFALSLLLTIGQCRFWFQPKKNDTRMHSSRMRIARSLTIFGRGWCLPRGGVCRGGCLPGVVPAIGGFLPGGCLPRGVQLLI